MTLTERRDRALADFAAGMEIICKAKTLQSAQWIAASCIYRVSVIANEGRVPSKEETIKWIESEKKGGQLRQ